MGLYCNHEEEIKPYVIQPSIQSKTVIKANTMVKTTNSTPTVGNSNSPFTFAKNLLQRSTKGRIMKHLSTKKKTDGNFKI